jgi:hypothetical protein
MSILLHPPLALVERELFGQDDLGGDGADALPPGAIDQAAVPPIPEYLLELVGRKVAATRAYAPQRLAVGQIRCLSAIPAAEGQGRRLGRTCAVLLGRWIEGRRWAGWMVVQEVDYASERDLVLQEDDGVLAPEAAVVQAWNPVEIALRGDEAILGKLPAERLGAVLKLSEPAPEDAHFVAPRPGRIGAWDIDGDTTVVTGTPLAPGDDPRAAYQQLYRRLAAECAAAALPARAARPDLPRRWSDWLRDTFVRPAWTFGALALVLCQTAWLFAGPGASQEEALYRGAAPVQADACHTRIRVMFKLDTPYSELVLALRRADATLVSGPSETGEIWILPAADQDPSEVAAMLRQNRLVEQVDVMAPVRRACKP